jgi:hypothetical protein
MFGIYLISMVGAAISIITIILALISKKEKGFAWVLCILGGGTALIWWVAVNFIESDLLSIYSVFHHAG